MKALAFILIFLLPLTLFSQTQIVTVTNLSGGLYSVSSSAGSQIVGVLPLGGGSYSFFAADGSSTMINLASGIYTLAYSNGASLGVTYINSLGSGRYSFSNAGIGTTGAVQSLSSDPIPLPALAVRPPSNNMSNTLLLAMLIQQRRQQCYAQGGFIYKPHWYSGEQCKTPDQIKLAGKLKEIDREGKQLKKESAKSKPH